VLNVKTSDFYSLSNICYFKTLLTTIDDGYTWTSHHFKCLYFSPMFYIYGGHYECEGTHVGLFTNETMLL